MRMSLAAVVLVLVLAACGGTGDGGTRDEAQDFTVEIRCPDGGVFHMELYISPIDGEPLYGNWPVCHLDFPMGTPGYDVSATLFGPTPVQYSALDWTPTITEGTATTEGEGTERLPFYTLPTIGIPPQPPGRYELAVEITDAEGRRGTASRTIEWGWRAEPENRRLEVTVQSPAPGPDGVLVELGEELVVTALARGGAFSAQPVGVFRPTVTEAHVFVAALISGDLEVEWDFGDGTRYSDTFTWAQGPTTGVTLAQGHRYAEPGFYTVTVAVAHQRLQSVSTAQVSLGVPPTGDAQPAVTPGEAPQPRWMLREVRINPDDHPLETEVIAPRPPEPTPTPVGYTGPPGIVPRGTYDDVYRSATVTEGLISVTTRVVRTSRATGELVREDWFTATFAFTPPTEAHAPGRQPDAVEVTGMWTGDWEGTPPAVTLSYGYGAGEFVTGGGDLMVSQATPEATGEFYQSLLGNPGHLGNERAWTIHVRSPGLASCDACRIVWVYEWEP